MTNTTSTKKSKTSVKPRVFSDFEKNKIVEKLISARIALLLKHPFFGNMATRMKLIDASDWCPTLATDGRNFYYSNDFVDKLKPKEMEFGFAHEVLHNIFDHLSRFGERDKQISNIAADFAVNQILVDDKIGEVPKFIQIFQDNRYRSWSFEQIYEDLEKRAKKISIEDLGELLDDHIDNEDGEGGESGEENSDKPGRGKRPRLTEEEKKQIRDEIKEAMIAAAQSADAGKLPAGIQRLISNFTEPKMDWRQILRMNIQSIIKNNFSFTRPNRKSQHSGAILPGLMNDETIDICVSIDMSGSINDAQARDMISEVKGIMDEYDDFKLRLWTFDTKVYDVAEFSIENADEIAEYKPKGGGGTLFECNWDFMKDNDIQPKKFIMFTDGYPCGGWGDEDYCDTLFIIHGTEKIVAPFGETAYYK
jgi:predicted metal-dependent peptidase